jgi:hypothetical protein
VKQAARQRAVVTEPEAAESSDDTVIDEVTFWMKEFGELDELPEIQEVSRPHETLITDAEIAEIEREVERELTTRGRRR